MVAPPGATVVVWTFVAAGEPTAACVYTRSKISPMTWNEDVAFGPPTPKKIRTVSPTLAFIGCSAVSAPTAPLKTKYSARSASSFSTLNSSWPRCPYVDHRVGALPGSQLRALRLANKLRLDL